MKKISFLLAILAGFAISCKKQTDNNFDDKKSDQFQQRPVCGMEGAMKSMSPEMKAAMMSSLQTEAQASELLLFLDFDGALITRGNANPSGYTSPIVNGTRNCPPPLLTEQQKEQIIALVKDDYSPFNIIVTTDQSVFNDYPAQNKQICIITTSPNVVGFPSGLGGISPFISVGFRLPFNPCFVFASPYGSDLAAIAGTICHETGHAMGLGHQHQFNETCGFLSEYNIGFGTGNLSFVPIMGIADGKRMINWYAQSCPSPAFGAPQNDFDLLSSQVVLKEDDFPDIASGSTVTSSGEIMGVLEQAGDVDFIRINFRNPRAVTISSENIDIKVSVYNGGGHLQDSYDDPNDTGVSIPSLSGNRYLKIEAVSNANISSQFMTGQYTIRY